LDKQSDTQNLKLKNFTENADAKIKTKFLGIRTSGRVLVRRQKIFLRSKSRLVAFFSAFQCFVPINL